MSKYYELHPSDSSSTFSMLFEHNLVTNTGKDGRWNTQGSDYNSYLYMVVPITKLQNVSDFTKDVSFTSGKFNFKFEFTDNVLKKVVGGAKKGWEAIDYIKYFISDVDHNANYLAIENGDLILYEHEKGKWSATVLQWYFKNKNIGEKIVDFILGGSAGELSKQYSINQDSVDAPFLLGSDYIDAGFKVKLTLTTKRKVLAKKGEYDIGQAYAGSNIGSNYCFYCTDSVEKNWLSYLGAVPYTTINKHNSRIHSCKKHNATPVKSENDSGVSNYQSTNLTYNSGPTLPDTMTLGKAESLSYGTTGDYKDGVARVPFVMIELRGSDDATVGYNISIPPKSLVSLTHERNMADSYNTFSLQLFDKDAMEIESKLLLGFRYITFYYTDFVSTSKRFKGEILNYKTTIAGKGLMLTLEGYSSNVDTYIGKDSIPWDILCEAGRPSFYYWMNEAGEYHGEVRLSDDGHWCSSEGNLVDTAAYDNVSKIGEYELKSPSKTQGEPPKWQTFTKYYTEKGADAELIKKFKPKAHKFTLSTNGYYAQLDNVLVGYEGFNLKEKRPSDIVKLICIINGWSYSIKPTKSVTEIPKQISMSYVEYIKKHLIPISVSDDSKSSTQYYFWFDDNGVAHYEPYNPSQDGIKKIYFNSIDHKDSYPLIGFTSATNGSVLMVTDASNTMEAINAYTGDEMSLTSVVDASDNAGYLSAVKETSDWYSTNKLTVAKDNTLKLVSYSNTSTLPSTTELKNSLTYRYGLISKYTYKASIDVYGCADLTPGNYIDVYIYLDDGARSNADVSSESSYWKGLEKEYNDSITYNDDGTYNAKLLYLDEEKHYQGNLTMHHTSGRYIINKITDTISAGKYVSSLEVLKIDKAKVLDNIEFYDIDSEE